MELNKKIADWLGFCWHDLTDVVGTCKKCGLLCGRIWSGNKSKDDKIHTPDFSNDLNACFEYIVPRLNEQGLRLHMITQPRNRDDFFCSIGGKWVAHECVYAKTPALALCRAVEKLIDKDGGN